MNPFTDSPSTSKPSFLGRLAARPALIVFLLCLLAGLLAVAWHARARARSAQSRARLVASERGAALEVQFSRALAATEALGVVAGQSPGTFTNFQRVAAALFAPHSSLASLELQPRGVVTDIVPRAGHQRVLGLDTLRDPARRLAANAAIRNHALTVAGPLPLYHGEPGLLANVPLFQRGPDGREYCWGFVAASIRLPDSLAGLWQQGYEYSFFPPAPPGQKPALIAAQGDWSSFQGAVWQPIRVHNLELRLALRARGGWLNKTKLALESLAVLCLAGLLSLLVNSLASQRATEAALADANHRLARETADHQQAQTDCRAARQDATAAQADLQHTRAGLQRADAAAAELMARLDTTVAAASAAAQAAQAKLKEAERSAAELQARFDASLHTAAAAAQARQAELEQALAALQQRQQTIDDLQARLNDTARAEQETAAAAQTRARQDQAAINDLQARLDAATRAAQEAAAAAAARLAQLEQSHNQPDLEEPAPEPPGPCPPAHRPILPILPIPPIPPTSPGPSEPIPPAPPTPPPPAEEPLPPASASDGQLPAARADAPAPPTNRPAQHEAIPPATTAPEPDAPPTPASTPPSPDAPLSASAPPALPKPPRPARPRRARREDQIDLFAHPLPTEESPAQPAAVVAAEEPVPVPPAPALVEPAPTLAASAAEAPASPSGGAVADVSGQPDSPVPAPTPPTEVQPPTAPPETRPAPPPTPPDLPDIEGLVTTDGLARVNGDARLYRQALRQFAELQAAAPEKIRDALLLGDSTAAHSLARDLASAARDLGAPGVDAAATALARAVHEQSDPGEIESLWAELEKVLVALLFALKPVLLPKEDKPAPLRRLPPSPPVNLAQLRKAVSLILPLLADGDPGAKDCLKDNRATFRSAFSPEAYLEFEQLIKSRDFPAALELLKKAARKLGLPS